MTPPHPLRSDRGQTAAFVALCIGAAAMGVSPLLVRYAAEAGTGPFASAFWRVFLSLPILYLWMRWDERSRAPPAGWRFDRPVLLAGVAFAGDLFFWHLSILHTTVANATFFATCAPVFVVAIGWAVLGRRVAGATLLGLGLCLAGGAALIGHSLRFAPERALGDLYGIVTAFFFALYFLAVKQARIAGTTAARATFLLSAVTAAVLLPVAIALDPRMLPRDLWGALSLLGLAWISQAGGQGLLSIALGRLPAEFSSLVIFLEALVAAALAWLLLGEALTVVQWGGGALILLGIWIARPRDGEDGGG